MLFLYQIIIHLAILVMAPKLIWARFSRGKYKQSFRYRLGKDFPELPAGNGPVFWLHGVSVGENKALAPLTRRIRKNYPDARILVTAITETGYAEANRSHPDADAIAYLPFDFSWVIRPIVRRIHPDYVILSETDLWLAFLDEAKRCGATISVVSGKLSVGSWKRLQTFSYFARRLFAPIDLVCAQNEMYAERYRAIGVERARLKITGNLKFDGVVPVLEGAELDSWRQALGMASDEPVIVGGSTHDPEEAELLEAMKVLWAKHPKAKLLLVPRHPDRFDRVAEFLSEQEVRFSRLSEGAARTDDQVVLVDQMGKLRACFQVASVGVVAGSFGSKVGGHNVLEPCDYGVPSVFGPHMETQEELRTLILDADAGRQVTVEDLGRTLLELVDNPGGLGANGKQLMQRLRGSLDRTWQALSL